MKKYIKNWDARCARWCNFDNDYNVNKKIDNNFENNLYNNLDNNLENVDNIDNDDVDS